MTMAGFGNAGVPPAINRNMEERIAQEEAESKSFINPAVWEAYTSRHASPYMDAASIMAQNRKAIIKDATKGMDLSELEIDTALRGLVTRLVQCQENDGEMTSVLYIDDEKDVVEHVANLAVYLDKRMCVPRDMGAMSAACVKNIAVAMKEAILV